MITDILLAEKLFKKTSPRQNEAWCSSRRLPQLFFWKPPLAEEQAGKLSMIPIQSLLLRSFLVLAYCSVKHICCVSLQTIFQSFFWAFLATEAKFVWIFSTLTIIFSATRYSSEAAKAFSAIQRTIHTRLNELLFEAEHSTLWNSEQTKLSKDTSTEKLTFYFWGRNRKKNWNRQKTTCSPANLNNYDVEPPFCFWRSWQFFVHKSQNITCHDGFCLARKCQY